MDIELTKISADVIKDSAIRSAASKKTDDYIESYEALKTNIAANKVIKAITLVKLDEKQAEKSGCEFGVIDGHTRLQIARELGHETIPAIVREAKNKQEIHDLALIANFSSVEMSAEDKAKYIAELLSRDKLDKNGNKIPMTGKNKDKFKKNKQEDVAALLGITQQAVSLYLKEAKKLAAVSKEDSVSVVDSYNKKHKYYKLSSNKMMEEKETAAAYASAEKSIQSFTANQNTATALAAVKAIKEINTINKERLAALKMLYPDAVAAADARKKDIVKLNPFLKPNLK